MRYKKITGKIIETLSDIVGTGGIFYDSDSIERYSRDETTGLFRSPEVVVKPKDARQISELLICATRERIPVTPRSGGTGVTGGAVPAHGGIVLSCERMNRIKEIDLSNLMAVVEPGVITGNLARRAREDNLFYPPDPASIDSCCIGGNVAESAGGPSAVKYGTTKDYVKGLEVVFANGNISQIGGKVVKNATGYDLIGLIVGSEGTLAVISEITARLLPLPPHSVDLLIPFSTLDEASRAVSEIIRARIIPCAIEFIEREALLLSRSFLKRDIPFPDAGAQLLVRLDGEDTSIIERDMERLFAICRPLGAHDIITATSSAMADRLWETRRTLREAIRSMSPVKESEDVVVPRSKIPEFVGNAKRIISAHGLSSIFFGHAGDGNIHVEIMKKSMPDDLWRERLPRAQRELYALARQLGGLISGEHGIGLIRREYLPLSIDGAQLEIMRGVKKAFDPRGILNPGKIFP